MFVLVPFAGAKRDHDRDTEFSGEVCNSRFHSGSRIRLLPPQSGVTRSRVAWVVSHRLPPGTGIDRKLATSWSTPTLTHPAWSAMS
jgi:hypothetical protein